MFKPKYTITNKILNNLTDIAEIKALVDRAAILPKQEIQLRRQALVRMIHSSTSIEGNILAKYEVEKALVGQKIDAPKRDIYEIKNYRDALLYISEFIEKKTKIIPKTILKIHGLVTKNTIDQDKSGHFRKDKVYVVTRRGTKIISVSYTAPPAKKVPGLVKNLVDWLNKSKKQNINPILVAGIAHAEIAAIHPFADGNGRTARLLATLILYERGYDFKKLFALEDYYNQNRPAYYQAIHLGKNYEERLKNNLTNWLEYFTQGFKIEMNNVKETVIPLSLDLKMRKKLGGPIYLNKRQIKIIDFVISMGKITSQDVTDIFNVDKRTAQRYINNILKTKLIKRKGKGPKTFYVLNT